MKKLILILGFLMMIFLVGGVLAENQTCVTEPGKAYFPGTEKCCNDLKSVFPYELPDGTCISPENDTRVGAPVCAPCGNGKCESNYGEDKCNCAEDCNKACANEGEIYSKVYSEYPKTCCEGLIEWDSGFDSRIVVNGTCKETGAMKGAPVGTCIKCGDGICGLNENVCNCASDCKNGCENKDNSCCKNGICARLFEDGLPSACSNGNLAEFLGCDADCKPVAECKNNSPGDGINATGPQDVICAPDKKQCLDGSYVERAGFDCEFMPCLSGEKVGFFEKIFNWFKNLFS